MSLSQNNYRDRLIEKLKQQLYINPDNVAVKEELALLLKSEGGASAENADKARTDTPTKKKE